MIDFERMTPDRREEYNRILFSSPERGCEYSFVNLYLWGKQKAAFLHDCTAIFSHFHGKSVYPYPIGHGDKKAVLNAILQDARERGIPCRITGITPRDKEELETLFPGVFLLCPNRDSFDYVYDIHDLADLRGRKYQSRRNHFNRFCTSHPDHQVFPITGDCLPRVKQFAESWYARRRESNPQGDYLLESLALSRACNHFDELDMDGIILTEGGKILAIAMASRLSEDTMDIHFEKAFDDGSGVYAAINCLFARYLRLKYPEVKFLNREDDMGLEGLRVAKLSYRPHHMVEKYWAYVQEDIHAD
ncbi:MAG: DUF2156 domain-containing protein [Oscillospiraceae bacterium]|nr:DUF2156 domain-containing protein [Oscillospiraceae bacterium]